MEIGLIDADQLGTYLFLATTYTTTMGFQLILTGYEYKSETIFFFK